MDSCSITDSSTTASSHSINVPNSIQTRANSTKNGLRSLQERKKSKQQYERDWESTFGKHTARCHPKGLVDVIKKEGKPVMLLVTLGFCASIIDYFIDSCVTGLGKARSYLLSIDSIQNSTSITFAIWSSFTIVVAIVGVLWTKLIDPVAAGSGIPEMKAIISCDLRKEADRYLKARTLLSKAVGLTFALGSSISVGREGPFVHFASILVHRLMKHVPFFRRIYRNDILRRHMYNAACAVGVASTFRAPVGGVLFSIEVTSTVFMVSNYWRAFVAAVSASITRQVVSLIHEKEIASYYPMFPTVFPTRSFHYIEFLTFTVLAVLMGLGGAAYVSVSSIFKQRWATRSLSHHPLCGGFFLLLPIILLLNVPGVFGQLSYWDIISDLTSPFDLSPRWHSFTSIFLVLIIAALCRLMATILSTTLPLPAGEFIPTFVAGATFGRFYGEVLSMCFPEDIKILPGGYALVGGAAFVAAVTHTVSVAVITMEFTGQFVYMTPLLLSAVVSTGIASALSVSGYDSVMIQKRLQYLPMLRVNELEGIKARDVMTIEFPVVALDTTLAQILQVLQTQDSEEEEQLSCHRNLPVVDGLENMIFYGCVRRNAIEGIVAQAKSHIVQEDTPAIPEDEGDSGVKMDDLRTNNVPIAPSDSFTDDENAPLPSSKALQSDAMDKPIHLRADEHIRLDTSVLQVDAEAPIEKVHLFFEMIKCSRIWVTRRGQLLGKIDRHHLHRRITELKHARSMNVL